MDMNNSPLPIDQSEQHRFNRAAIYGLVAVCAGNSLDAQYPGHIVLRALVTADKSSWNCGAKGCIRLKVMAGIFIAAVFDAT